ncbi:MAG: hypothetical protein JNL28_15110 [Planctomycetes bacterium]|nr:hypothetical protein [Planctomycetota bacterium]
MHSEPKRAPRARRDEVWRSLFERQSPAVALGMCQEFQRGIALAGLEAARMPRPRSLSRRLHDLCGWRIETVPGLIPAAEFFALLRDRRFPSPDWIRHPDDLEYTPEPDAFHDLFGHVPQLASAKFGNVLEQLASAARGADAEELTAIERVYWFTIEFGLVRENDAVKALGAGLASSIAELDRALHAPAIERRRFMLSNARQSPFETDRPQELYMVADSLEGLVADLHIESWDRVRRAG